jgi:hypothetical protein
MTQKELMDGTAADMVKRIARERGLPGAVEPEVDPVVRITSDPVRRRTRRPGARLFPDAPRNAG